MCCLVCVCFVQAVSSVANQQEDAEILDGTGLGCRRTAIVQFTYEPMCRVDVRELMLAGRISLTREKKQITVHTFPCSRRKIMHFTNEDADGSSVRKKENGNASVGSFLRRNIQVS